MRARLCNHRSFRAEDTTHLAHLGSQATHLAPGLLQQAVHLALFGNLVRGNVSLACRLLCAPTPLELNVQRHLNSPI